MRLFAPVIRHEGELSRGWVKTDEDICFLIASKCRRSVEVSRQFGIGRQFDDDRPAPAELPLARALMPLPVEMQRGQQAQGGEDERGGDERG